MVVDRLDEVNIHMLTFLNFFKIILLFYPCADIHYSGPDLEDVRESVRHGVTKVAGRISSMATDMMSSLQDKYGG